MSRVLCPAKVNLGLLVSPPGPDGYHELHTVFQAIGLYDRLELQAEPARASAIEIACNVPELAAESNLAFRAAEAVLAETKKKAEVKLRLRKNIPLGAGLGGGSSDAAGVLRGLPPLLGRPLPLSRLLEIAARLGADVPFFVLGGRALGLGRGAHVFPLPEQRPQPLLVVHPGFYVSTGEAYRKLDELRCEDQTGEAFFGVRQLAAPALRDRSLLRREGSDERPEGNASFAATCRFARQQAAEPESGSKLPHSKGHGTRPGTSGSERDAVAPYGTLTTVSRDHMIFYFCASVYRRRWDRLANDFEPVVFSAYPQLARLKKLLLRAGASPALLAGSGSAVFGMFATVQGAKEAAAQVRERWPQWNVWVTRTVRRAGIDACRD